MLLYVSYSVFILLWRAFSSIHKKVQWLLWLLLPQIVMARDKKIIIEWNMRWVRTIIHTVPQWLKITQKISFFKIAKNETFFDDFSILWCVILSNFRLNFHSGFGVVSDMYEKWKMDKSCEDVFIWKEVNCEEEESVGVFDNFSHELDENLTLHCALVIFSAPKCYYNGKPLFPLNAHSVPI